MTELEDMRGNLFTEGDYVIYADRLLSLRIARVRGIKGDGHGHQIALEIVEGMGVNKMRYSRRYHPDDFLKTDYTS